MPTPCLRTSGKGPSLTNAVQPGDKVFVKVFRRKWFNERREGPFEVVRSTGTAVQVKGSPTWYHLSHCVKAPTEEVPRSQNRDTSPTEPRHMHISKNKSTCSWSELHGVTSNTSL
uniref:Murine leukemia virus integrase C-terminal domain-containing protein n=1 Tax=Labrus bergylta TaxID=56723 RepID=A0A3Q3GZH6_9LABR